MFLSVILVIPTTEIAERHAAKSELLLTTISGNITAMYVTCFFPKMESIMTLNCFFFLIVHQEI